jgi:predicted phosphodiesterase
MTLALLYDVHGNQLALEAVLDDARAQGVDSYLLGGDYALFGPYPRETVERLRQLEPATWIRGNVDRWSAHPDEAPDHPMPQGAIAACRELLGDELVAELGALPGQVVVDGTRYCHASPLSDVRSFFPEPAEDEEELLDGVTEERLVFGHTHLPFSREGPDGIVMVNPGSVGIPLDGDTRAAYAIVNEAGEVEQRRVEYDHLASATALRERFDAEFAEVVARRIENARLETG